MITNTSKYSWALTVILVIVIIARFFSHSYNPNSHKKLESQTTSTEQTSKPPLKNDAGLNRNETHLILSRHAKCRMECRHITENEIKEILHEGNINYKKSDLQAESGPKYAVEGYLPDHQHLRVIFAPESNAIVVVTCIDLDNEWQCPSCN